MGNNPHLNQVMSLITSFVWKGHIFYYWTFWVTCDHVNWMMSAGSDNDVFKRKLFCSTPLYWRQYLKKYYFSLSSDVAAQVRGCVKYFKKARGKLFIIYKRRRALSLLHTSGHDPSDASLLKRYVGWKTWTWERSAVVIYSNTLYWAVFRKTNEYKLPKLPPSCVG